MEKGARKFSIVVADDDLDDCKLIEDAFNDCGYSYDLRFVHDGEELIDCLLGNVSTPAFILLDLNMPKKDGREALNELKSDPRLRHIPVIVFTTSQSDEDIVGCYRSGANSFVTKPNSFGTLVQVSKELIHYWFATVKRPNQNATESDLTLNQLQLNHEHIPATGS